MESLARALESCDGKDTNNVYEDIEVEEDESELDLELAQAT